MCVVSVAVRRERIRLPVRVVEPRQRLRAESLTAPLPVEIRVELKGYKPARKTVEKAGRVKIKLSKPDELAELMTAGEYQEHIGAES